MCSLVSRSVSASHLSIELTNYLVRHSLLAAAQYSAQANPAIGYTPWIPGGPQPPYVENFYNNPIQYTNGSSNNMHRYPMGAPNHQINAAGLPYPHNQQTSKSCHSHYPNNHPHAVDYQPYHPNNGLPRKCGNVRMCNSYDALTSPQQPLLPNPANWNGGPAKTNGYHSHKCAKQSSQQQLYQCTSECSDHSLKSHSQHSQSSQERAGKTTGNCKDNCHHRSAAHNGKHQPHNGKGSTTSNHCGTSTTSSTTNGNDILNGNDNIYENDDETTEHDRMITSTSDCCSSVDEVDGDSCCSCSLYAEATDPPQVVATIAQSQSTASNQMAKVAMQN